MSRAGRSPQRRPVSAAKEGVPSRRAAFDTMMQITEFGAWASQAVDRVLGSSRLDDRDRSFAANLVFSTVRKLGTIDWILAAMVTRDLADVEPELVNILRLGTWELTEGASPDHAAVDSWAEVARNAIGNRAVGFANGVLRNVARGVRDLPWPPRSSDAGAALAFGYPEWIVTLARHRVGEDRLEEFLEAGNTPAPLCLRAVGDRDKLLASLQHEGIAARAGTLSDHAVILQDRVPPSQLRCLQDGRAMVQDQSSQVVGQVAADGVPPGSLVLDLCAAPGGKATHLAQLGLTVMAVDSNQRRLDDVSVLAARLGVGVSVLHADGRDPGMGSGEAAAVLLDAPCSGLGVVRRRPELRWRKEPSDISALAELQRELLASAIDLTRPGGRITYSVCTWTEEETDAVVDTALAAGEVELGALPDIGTPTRHGRQLAPDTDAGDGMYLTVLTRR